MISNKIKQLGINIPIQYINGTGNYHYYDQVNNIIVIDLNAQLDDLMESIVHEYIHHIQWCNGYRKLMVWEIDNIPYDKRSFEYHAELVCTHIDEFTNEEGKLDITNILNYYDDIVDVFYEK